MSRKEKAVRGRRIRRSLERADLLYKKLRRGGEIAVAAMAQLKTREAANVQRSVLLQILGTPELRRAVIGSSFPQSYKALAGARGILPVSNTFIEFRWTSSVLAAFSSELNAFLASKAAFEAALLVDDLAGAQARLENIEKRFGCSLWLIESGLLLAERRGGLEANRKFLAAVRDDTQDQIIQLLTYFWSQRSEANMSAANYVSNVDAFLRRQIELGANPATLAYVRFKLNFWHSSHQEYAGHIVWLESRHSIIDFYLTWAQLLEEAVMINETGAALMAIEPSVFKMFDDPRLRAVAAFLNPGIALPPTQLDNAGRELSDEYTRGNYATCVGRGAEMIRRYPTSLEFYELTAKSHVRASQPPELPLPESSPARDLFFHIVSVLRKEEESRPALAAILKFSCTFASFPISHQAFGFVAWHRLPYAELEHERLISITASALTARFANLFSSPATALIYIESISGAAADLFRWVNKQLISSQLLTVA